MAATNLPAPAVFMDTPGEPRLPFLQWVKAFKNYLSAIDGDSFADSRKCALLIHCLGAEGQRLYYALPEHSTTFDATLDTLTAFFSPKTNVVAERYKFRSRSQLPGETVDHFIAALREQATKCVFLQSESEMLRDQLIEKTSVPRIRERLLLEDDLKLDKAILLARHVESAINDAKTLIQTDPRVSAITTTKPRNREKPRSFTHRNEVPAKPVRLRNDQYCFRCGSKNHLASFPSCPAKDATCTACSKKGHFFKVCQSSSTRTIPRTTVNEVSVPEMTILNMNNAPSDSKLWCDAAVTFKKSGNKNYVRFVVDTGSAVSLIPYDLCPYLSVESGGIDPSHTRLVTYSGEPLKVIGCTNALVTVGSTTKKTCFHIVEKGMPILGLDMLKAFGMHAEDTRLILPELGHATIANVSSNPSILGYAKGFCHKIRIQDGAIPVKQKLRRLPLTVRDAVTTELKALQEKGIIERIDSSEWISPIVVTKKKDNGIRMCVDLRELNKVIIPDAHPLPIIDDLLSELRGSTVFSKLDLKEAYHQLLLHEDSRDATAFITHEGLFRFCRVPFGLCSASSAFEKLMDHVLEGLPGVKHYQDDLIVHGKDYKRHDMNLDAVIRRIHDAGLQLNMTKCELRRDSLDFLGVRLTKQGIHPTETHLQAILNAPQPTSLTALRSFLGLAAWYSKFIPNFADVVEPLRECTRGASDFTWTAAAQHSFQMVKSLLGNASVLSPFDPALPTTVTTDASDVGLGAVLTQLQSDGHVSTVAFASRTLTDTERRYSIVEKEALACVWATEKWRTWLWGRKFTLETDHRALTTLLSTKGNDRAGLRLARWSARLLSFNYHIRYIKGDNNVVADCLSRLPLPIGEHEKPIDPDMVATVQAALGGIPQDRFTTESDRCPILSSVLHFLTAGWPSSPKALEPFLQPYYRVRDELSFVNGLVMRGPYRVVVPASLQKELLQLAHETHQGMSRTKQRLRESYWWPAMDSQVEELVRQCVTCRAHDKTARLRSPPLTPVPLPSGPWKKLGIDIVGPFEQAPAHLRFCVTMVDYFSKWPELAFAASMDTDAVITFMESIFSREGYPDEVVTDNGPQFVSRQFSEFLLTRNIRHVRCSVYHPQANGEIERFNRVLKDAIQTATIEKLPWKPFLTKFLMTYRATPHASTMQSPSLLLHGRPLRTNLETFTLPHRPVCTQSLQDRVERTQAKMKAYADHRHAAMPHAYDPGDFVRIKKPRRGGKLQSRFSPPKKIKRRTAPNTYEMDDGNRFHASMMAPAYPPSQHTPPETFEPLPELESRRSSRPTKPPSWMKDYV